MHEKIVNFMAPRRIKIPPNSGDLLKNLFGLKTRNGLLQVTYRSFVTQNRILATREFIVKTEKLTFMYLVTIDSIDLSCYMYHTECLLV